jgi:hypothetical protein
MFRDTLVAGLALTAVMLPVAAQAACPSDSTIFACTTTNGKFVEVCEAGKVIQYTFGRRGQTPELALSVPRDQASTFQWAGVGRYISYSVTIPNGNTRYQVFFSVDRLSETQEIEAGINVEFDGTHVATVDCKMDTVIHNMEGIDLKSDFED